jgi:hypothetical protein
MALRLPPPATGSGPGRRLGFRHSDDGDGPGGLGTAPDFGVPAPTPGKLESGATVLAPFNASSLPVDPSFQVPSRIPESDSTSSSCTGIEPQFERLQGPAKVPLAEHSRRSESFPVHEQSPVFCFPAK